MATKVKPSRLQVSGTPQAGQVPVYVDEDTFSWGDGGGDAKLFSLSNTSDLTTAQDAYDWYLASKTPVVRYDGGDYLVEFADSSKVILCSTGYHKETETSYNGRTQNNLIFNLSSDTVTSIVTSYGGNLTMYYLSPAVNYTTPYTPQYDGSPATKKYVDDKVSDTAYANSWDGVTGIAPSKNAVYDKINSIDALIPSAATSSNKLTDKNYVDDSINQVAAYYITKNAAGDAFSTHAELAAATTFYSGGATRTPTRNDYCIILADETHSGACTRYTYQGAQWEYQYTVNESPMSQAQLDALNSGITAAKVTTYDGYASTIAGKQDTLSTQTAYTNQGTSTKVPTISTNTLGQVTGISETSIAFPVTSVNGQTGAVTGLQTTANLKTGLSDNSDTYYPSQKAVKTAVDSKQDKSTSGSGAPSSTPTFVGQLYIDSTNDKMYFAAGTSSSSDWTLVGSGSGMGDVTGPASSTDSDIVLFDGATGKIIKDGNKKLTDLVQTSGNQTIAGTKTFSTSPVVPSKTTDATNTGTAVATEAQVYKKQDKLTAQTAYTSQGGATKVPQITTNTLGQVTGITEVTITQPTVNDGTLTITQNGTSKGIFTANQSSAATIALTDTTYESKTAASGGEDVSLVTTGEKYTWNNKQNALSSQTAYTSKGTATKVPTITTNTLGQVTAISETAITFPVTSVNGSTGTVTVSEFNPGGTATTGYVVTKTAGGYEWQAPTGGISLDANSPITVSKLRVGTEAQYSALGSYDASTIYMTV